MRDIILYRSELTGKLEANDEPTAGNPLVQETLAQTLTNKTLTSPTITGPTISLGVVGIAWTAYSTDQAIAITPHVAILSKAGVGAYTIAAPTVNGTVIDIVNSTSNAHVVTGTNLFWAGETGGPFNKLTCPAFPGHIFRIIAVGGLWHVMVSGLGGGTVGD